MMIKTNQQRVRLNINILIIIQEEDKCLQDMIQINPQQLQVTMPMVKKAMTIVLIMVSMEHQVRKDMMQTTTTSIISNSNIMIPNISSKILNINPKSKLSQVQVLNLLVIKLNSPQQQAVNKTITTNITSSTTMEDTQLHQAVNLQLIMQHIISNSSTMDELQVVMVSQMQVDNMIKVSNSNISNHPHQQMMQVEMMGSLINDDKHFLPLTYV